MNLQPEHDEIHILGDIPDQDWILEEMRRYLKHAYVMPFDLNELLAKK